MYWSSQKIIMYFLKTNKLDWKNKLNYSSGSIIVYFIVGIWIFFYFFREFWRSILLKNHIYSFFLKTKLKLKMKKKWTFTWTIRYITTTITFFRRHVKIKIIDASFYKEFSFINSKTTSLKILQHFLYLKHIIHNKKS